MLKRLEKRVSLTPNLLFIFLSGRQFDGLFFNLKHSTKGLDLFHTKFLAWILGPFLVLFGIIFVFYVYKVTNKNAGRWIVGRWIVGRWIAGRWIAGRWIAGRWNGGPVLRFVWNNLRFVCI